MSQKSKSREHLKALKQRMNLWTSGETLELVQEGETIQRDLGPLNISSTFAKICKKFTREMYKENVNNAMNLVCKTGFFH